MSLRRCDAPENMFTLTYDCFYVDLYDNVFTSHMRMKTSIGVTLKDMVSYLGFKISILGLFQAFECVQF